MENEVGFLEQYAVYALLLVVVVDYVLGKTPWVKANSSLEAILKGVVGILKSIFGKKE